MNEAKELLDKWLIDGGFDTYKELAKFLGVAQNTIDVWKQRGKIPEKNILKYTQLQKNQDKPLHVNTITATKLSPIVSAGNGSNVECIDSVDKMGEFVMDVCTFKTPPTKKLYAMQVDGYSMTPMIFPDSWVVFEEVGDFRGDGLYIVNWRNVIMEG